MIRTLLFETKVDRIVRDDKIEFGYELGPHAVNYDTASMKITSIALNVFASGMYLTSQHEKEIAIQFLGGHQYLLRECQKDKQRWLEEGEASLDDFAIEAANHKTQKLVGKIG